MSIVRNFGTPADALANATRFRPPAIGNTTTQALTAAAVYAFETGAAATSPTHAQGPGWYSFASSAAFNIVFDSDATIANPTDNGVFPAGVYSFYLTDQMGYCELMPNANGSVTWWKSSYGSE